MRRILIAILLMVVIGCPAYVRSLMLYGDPVYPFGHEWITPQLPDELVESGRVDGREMLTAFRVYPSQWDTVLWRLVYEDNAPWSINNRGYGPPASTIGWVPVVAVLVWLYGVAVGRGRAGALLMVAGLGIIAAWVLGIGVMEPRYAMMGLPVLCAGMGKTINEVWK